MPIARFFLALVALAAVPAAAASNPAFDAANKAHMESMDAYFTCAFAAMRASRAKGIDAKAYLATLNAECAAEEKLLRERSVTFAEARGMTADKARAKADEAVAAARRDLIRTYSGQ